VKPPVRLFFDRNSGLLVRMVRYADTPVGRTPTQIDYADYREMDGVKSPFRWTLSRPNGRFTIQVKEVTNNVAIEDAKFARPEGDVK
jgi:photosynthetic reaction center cytochrome c subunit